MAIIGTATVEIHATLDAVRDEIKKGLDEALANINGNIKLTVDNAEANVKLDDTKKKVDGLDGSEPTIKPNVDDTEANAKLFAIKTKVDEFGNKTWTIKLKADTAEADAKLAASKAMADKGLNLKADASEAVREFDKVGFALSGLGFSVNIWGSAVFDKFALIGGAAAAAGGAIGSAFAAVPALLGGMAASALAVKEGFSGVGSVIQGMAPDATKAQVQAMVKELAEMGPAAQGTAIQLGAMVNGPLTDLKKNIQDNLLGSLNGDFTELGTTTVPILDTAMQGVATSMGTGLHTAIQNLIAQGPQLTSMFGGIQSFAKTLGTQTIPTVSSMFVNMGAAAGPAMDQVGSGFQSIFAGMNSIVSNAIFTGQFTQAVAALGPVFQGLGNVINPLLGGIIQLGAALGGPLGNALTAIGKLIGPLIPILSSLGQQVLGVITVLANSLTPILQSLTPLLEEFFSKLGEAAMDDFKALAPLIQTLATAFLQILNAIEPLLGPFSTTFQLFDALGKIVQSLVPIIQVFVGVVVKIVDALTNALGPVIPAIVKAFQDFGTAITPILPILGELIVKLINGLAPILPTLIQLIDNVIKAMVPWIPTIMQILPPLLSLVLTVLPPLNGLLKFLADNSWIVVAALSAWASIKLVSTVSGWAGSLGQFATKLSYLPNAAGDGEKAASTLISNFKELPGAVSAAGKGLLDFSKSGIKSILDFGKSMGGGLLGAVKSFGAALIPVIASVWSFTAALLANPITWIVLGIAALIAAIVLLITHFSEVKKVFLEVWGAISKFFEGVWKDIKNIAETVWKAISGFFEDAWNKLVGAWKAVWGAVSGFFTSIWNDIKNVATTVWNAITGFFHTIWDAVAGYFEKLWNVRFKQPVMDVWNAISNFLTTAFNDFKAFFEAIWNGISDFFGAIWNGIKAVATFIWDAIVAYFTTAFNVYKTIFETVWNVISTIFTTVWNVIKNVAMTVWNAISSFFTTAFDAFKAAFEFVWNLISGIFSTVWNAIKTVASTVWGWISSFFTAEFNGFKAIFETVWNAISSVFSTVWNAIKSVATTVWGAISGFFEGAWNGIRKTWDDIWNGISNTFSTIWNGIKSFAQSVWDGIKSTFTGAINGVIGFINGLLHGINKVLDFFFIPKIPDIPTLAAGGVLTLTPELAAGGALGDGIAMLASGGNMWESVGGGFKTNGPRAIVGEGNPMYPEYVIPTDPTHRQRALGLLGNAARDMGLGGGGKATIPGVHHATGPGGAPMLGLGDLLSSAWNATGGKVVHGIASAWDDVTSWIGTKVAEGVHGLVDAAKSLMPNNIVGHMVDGALDKLANGLISWITKKNAEEPKAGVSGNVQSWAPTVQKVLSQLNVPQSALNGVLNIIQHESGGNPNAINNWDSNAQAGHPSQGLMQTIPSTFAAYAGPYVSKGITDGMANIYAGVNYAIHRYGVQWLINGGNKNSSGGYAGYDSGGWLAPGITPAINLTGKNEAVLPIDMMQNAIVAAVHAAFAFPGSARNLSPAQFANGSAGSGDVNIHEGAFQVTINGNADSVTVAQLQQTLTDWNNELVYQLRGRR